MTDQAHGANVDDLAQQAMTAIHQGDPQLAAELLAKGLAANPDRIDLRHALSVTLLQVGNPAQALAEIREAEELAMERGDEAAATLISQIVLTRAAAAEDLALASEAEEAYRRVLEHEPENPGARQGLGHLLLAWGRIVEGVAVLTDFISDESMSADFTEGTGEFLDALRRFRRDDIHPQQFLDAHQGVYVEFFDHHAREMEKQGWIAEAARMKRDESGRVVPIIPEGARPYAGTRVDLVDPRSGQPGLVGDQPMPAAMHSYEPLSQAPVLFEIPHDGFRLWVSSVCPWNDLTVQIRFAGPGSLTAADATIGDWYEAGFNGSFGTAERGRFHSISDPESTAPDMVAYKLDCGRADVGCIADLLRRLAVLHGQHPIRHVALGRGYLPA